MNVSATTQFEIPPVESHPERDWLKPFRQGEDRLTALVLLVMMLLPVAGIVLREVFHSDLPGSTTLVQHLVLAVGMLGGALAARDNRLLSFSGAVQWLPDRASRPARVFSHAFSATVSVFLCAASWQYVASQRALGRELALGIPVWAAQLVLVAGFGLIALRLLRHAADNRAGRFVALGLAAVLVALAAAAPVEPETLRWPALAMLFAAVVCGAPVFIALGGAALILFWTGGDPIAVVPLKHYALTVSPTLPSIPLFTLAGCLLAEGGAAGRLVRVFSALFGNLRGGPVIVTVLASVFFTSFTGASGVTILALGGLLMPVLVASHYRRRPALGLLTAAGSLGLLFPPCLPPILYSIIASGDPRTSVSMEEMFKGGLLPGLLMVGMTIWWGLRGVPRAAPAEHKPFNSREVVSALWAAKWELLVPVVALGALFGGFATPVEAAALTALFAFIVEVCIHRDLTPGRDVPRVLAECGRLIGGVLLIFGVALGFTYYLIDAQVPDLMVGWVTAAIHSKWLFLIALNGFLLVVGGLMDIYSAIVVIVPLIVPVAVAFGVEPVHLGIIFLANLELGYLTPPVGMNLFLSSSRFGRPLGEVTRATLPMLAVLAAGVLLITYVPVLTTWLPSVWK